MDHFPTLARFNGWANERLYGAVATLSDEVYRRDSKAYFGSVHATLNHILVVDRSWTGWIEGRDRRSRSLDQILYNSFSALRDARREEDGHLVALVESLTAADFDRRIRFRPTGGQEEGEAKAWQILATVFNHQTHHRGQVHALLTQAGVTPPPLDLICYLEEIGASLPPGAEGMP